MKSKVIIFLLALSLLIPSTSTKAASNSNLNGRILLQVESKGEAWYVNPKDGKRYYMADGAQAFQIMKTLGVGMSNKDVDKMKTDVNFRKKFIGKILLQVESKGEAYYISFDGRYNYLKDGASAYQVMRKLGLGISNTNLNKVSEKKEVIQVSDKQVAATDLFSNNLASCKAYKTNFVHPFTGETMNKEIFGIVDGKCKYIEQMPNGGQMECKYTESERVAIAKYYLDIAKESSTKIKISFGLTQGSVKSTYTVNGKEVSNPLQEALNNGACMVSGHSDSPVSSNSNLNGNLEIKWGSFSKIKNSFDEDMWSMPIKITNNENKMVVLDINGVGKGMNWNWKAQNTLNGGESETYNLNIDHYFFKKVAFDKKDIKISTYECNELSASDAKDVCLSEWGSGGKSSPWDVIESRKKAGTPIAPTLISEKYFNFNSLTISPVEISKEEYLK
jgi:hypothetical protein